ncbi:hypothetical protein BGX38DRAFT_1180994 [Terfezia claveryi]|nr:hypothetical protein BGX38DRAFT_1180994 [Terfezia claveryi]
MVCTFSQIESYYFENHLLWEACYPLISFGVALTSYPSISAPFWPVLWFSFLLVMGAELYSSFWIFLGLVGLFS